MYRYSAEDKWLSFALQKGFLVRKSGLEWREGGREWYSRDEAGNTCGNKILQREPCRYAKGTYLGLLTKRNPPKCFKQGSDMTIFVFSKGHSGSRMRKNVDPGKVQEQNDMLRCQWSGSMASGDEGLYKGPYMQRAYMQRAVKSTLSFQVLCDAWH